MSEIRVFGRVNGALMYGAYMLGQALVMAPGFAGAKTCCARILSVVHREPKVKTEEGVKDDQNWVIVTQNLMNLEFDNSITEIVWTKRIFPHTMRRRQIQFPFLSFPCKKRALPLLYDEHVAQHRIKKVIHKVPVNIGLTISNIRYLG